MMKTTMKYIIPLLALLMVSGSLSLTLAGSRAVTVVGAAEMASLVSNWARMFEKEHATSVVVFGSNDEGGYQALMEGRAHVAMVTKEPSNDIKLAASKKGIAFDRRRVGWNGLVIVVNSALPVESVSMDQLAKVFGGEYTNWKQLGGPDLPIKLHGLDLKLHGEGAWLQDRVLKGAPFSTNIHLVEKQRLMMLKMTKEPGAIGYGSFGMYRSVLRALPRLEEKVRLLSVSRDASSPAVEPNNVTISNMDYPLVKPGYLCINAQVERQDVTQFVDFCIKQGQMAMARSLTPHMVSEAEIDSDPTR